MKIVKKLIWFVIFIIIAIIALVLVYKAVLKFEFADSVKYQNIKYANAENNVCLTFSNNGYKLDDCKGGKSELSFDSSNNCKMYYGSGYSSFIFDCGLKNINLVKLKEYSFNKIIFDNKGKEYVLVNNSVFSTMEGLQKIDFTFIGDSQIKFSKHINDQLVDEETCNYTYGSDESFGLECSRFYGYSAFKIEKYDKDKLLVINRGNKITFTLNS